MDALNTPQSYAAVAFGLSVVIVIQKWLSRRGSDMARIREAVRLEAALEERA